MLKDALSRRRGVFWARAHGQVQHCLQCLDIFQQLPSSHQMGDHLTALQQALSLLAGDVSWGKR